MTAENNVAAQAGDEPMQAARSIGTDRAFEAAAKALHLAWTPAGVHALIAAADAFVAAQVSPRATADVERDAARYRFLRQEHWSNGNFCVVRDPKKSVKLGMDCPSHELLDNAIDAFIATTKPGA